MPPSSRFAPAAALLILGASIASAPRTAAAQGAPAGNPGQFGGSAPGQFDPNATPGATPTPGGPAPAASPFGDMNAGGLTPPPPAPPPGGPTQPTNPNDPGGVLDASKEEDEGRGITWFWLEAGGGFEHVGLQTIDGGAPSATGTGPMVDGGLGARLLFFTIGARGRLGFFEDFDLARVGGDVGLRIPVGSIEPRIDIGGGFAAAMNEGSATGFYARVGGGLDVFVSGNFALGGDVSADLVGLSADTGGGSSSSLGLGVALGLHAGLHL